MKTAIITPTLSHFEVPLFRIAANLPGLDVRVFHMDLREDERHDPDYGTTISWGEQLRSGFDNEGHADIAALKRALSAWKPDVALQYGYAWKGALGLLSMLRREGVPVVHRGLLTPYINTRQNPVVTRLWRGIQPYLLRRFQAHHYGGTYSEAVLERAGVPASQRYFVPYSVDTPFFAAKADTLGARESAVAIRAGLDWSQDDPVLLFLCQQNWFKAPDVMLKVVEVAQKQLPNLKLLMAGSGHMTDELKAYAEAHLLPGSCHFPGYVSSKETMPYYLAADLVVFPSRYDTWSRGVNEAMLARRPCIVSRVVPAAGGLVEHGRNGYIVDGLEPGPFVECIAEFLAKSEAERQTMGEAARTRAHRFSYEAQTDNLQRSFLETVEAAMSQAA